jgi:hypothetical protein
MLILQEKLSSAGLHLKFGEAQEHLKLTRIADFDKLPENKFTNHIYPTFIPQ